MTHDEAAVGSEASVGDGDEDGDRPGGATGPGSPALSPEYLETFLSVLDRVRRGTARTRQDLVRTTGLGRNVVNDRLAQLIAIGLVVEGGFGPSTGGRAPRELRFDANAGRVLAAELGATSVGVSVSDLAGHSLVSAERPADIADGPDVVLATVTEMADELLAAVPQVAPLWGVGVGLPGPVEFASGSPISPPIMPGWDGFAVRDHLAQRYRAPVWVDNEVNLMALGEHRAGAARGHSDFIYVKVGSGIGAGLVSGGRLHRGAQGCAGDIGHVAVVSDVDVVCRCGKVGCLEAVAGGAALRRQGIAAAESGRSRYLADLAARGYQIDAVDVGRGAERGDSFCVQLLTESARVVGETLARLVNFFNPSLIVLGGGVVNSGDRYVAGVKEVVFRRSLPLATRDLRIARSPLGMRAGLMGSAFMVIDELLAATRLAAWIEDGTPAGRPELATL